MVLFAALLGYATTVIPRWVTYYLSSLMFAVFGIKMLREGMFAKSESYKTTATLVQYCQLT